jgi:hypothetical protein
MVPIEGPTGVFVENGTASTVQSTAPLVLASRITVTRFDFSGLPLNVQSKYPLTAGALGFKPTKCS